MRSRRKARAKRLKTPSFFIFFSFTKRKNGIHEKFELRKVFRQKDEDFVDILNQIRHGQCTESSRKVLESCVGKQLENVKPRTENENKKVRKRKRRRCKEGQEKKHIKKEGPKRKNG